MLPAKIILLSFLGAAAVGSVPDHLGFDPDELREGYVQIVHLDGQPMVDVDVRFELVEPTVWDLFDSSPSAAGSAPVADADLRAFVQKQREARERERWEDRLAPRSVRTDASGIVRIPFVLDRWTFELEVEPTEESHSALKERVRGDRMSKDKTQPSRLHAERSTIISGRITVEGLPVSQAVLRLQSLPNGSSNVICLPSDEKGEFRSPPHPAVEDGEWRLRCFHARPRGGAACR